MKKDEKEQMNDALVMSQLELNVDGANLFEDGRVSMEDTAQNVVVMLNLDDKFKDLLGRLLVEES